MTTSLRPSTLGTLGLGSVLDLFHAGALPVTAASLCDELFGTPRGALVISGASGIVGSGKAMQLGSRLAPYGVPTVALDLPGAPSGLRDHYAGLVRSQGRDAADRVFANLVELKYDGKSLPAALHAFKPRFLLEAIPEVLELKRAHYEVFRASFPGIEIRSVTSGFPARELGVGIAHPAFPHEVNKVFEIVEPEPSLSTKLLWALGLIPIQVSDDWSFVLDVLFCGVTLAGLRYHEARNMPYWKIDKLVRKHLGPNPFRAHDAIGAKGADFLTWSCLHHLSKVYGALFEPTADLVERKSTGQDWYPPNHLRPIVDWRLSSDEEAEFLAFLEGAMFQMSCLLVAENRGQLAAQNAIGELCAQFRTGILAVMRSRGADAVLRTMEAYHRVVPGAASSAFLPEVLSKIETPEWQQLYVNAEHDGRVGVLTISRESYSWEVDAEFNRALDWLKGAGIGRVLVTSDFHLSTQMVGADTNDFFPALADQEAGAKLIDAWSTTARRLETDFETSVAVVVGKRCMGGFLELLMHCHFVVAHDDAQLAMPEVGLPVVPGMEGCHLPFRRAEVSSWPKLLTLLLTGAPVKAKDAVGWLVDAAGSLEDVLRTAYAIASHGDHRVPRRTLALGPLPRPSASLPSLPAAPSRATEAARKAILDTIDASVSATRGEAFAIQKAHAAAFLASDGCRRGQIGAARDKTLNV